MKHIFTAACTILIIVSMLMIYHVCSNRTSPEIETVQNSVGDTIISSETAFNMIVLITNDRDTIVIDNCNQFDSGALDGFILAPPVKGTAIILEDKDNNRILINSIEIVSVNGVIYL